jgi:outer membrane protein OmpA-like peptidoglycan-associated protein
VHLRSQKIPQGIQLAWEDGRSGGDRDFDDLVISLTLPLFWELSLISSDSSQAPQWKLEIGKENDLPLIALPLSLYPLGEKKFILATQHRSTHDELKQQPFFLPQRELESAIIALEVSEKASDFRNLIADIQLRLKDEQTNPETRLTIRLLLNLLLTGLVDVLEEAEITGQWGLKNHLLLKTETLPTSECQHRVAFYCDRAKVPTLEIFSLLRGRGPSQAIAIGTIAEHKITLKDKSYIWQAAQPLWITTFGRIADTYLGTVERYDSKSRSILFPIDSFQVNSNDSKLKEALKILQENLETTAKLEGYTSADGEGNSNQVLSEKRAEAVKQWLIQQKIDPARLTAQGMGEIASGNADQDRRTDIIIYSVKRPTIPSEQLPSLAIEAGAVFELSKSKLLSSPTDGSADIENSSIRLLIRSLLRNETDLAYLLRIPFVSSLIESKLWPVITLVDGNGQPIFRDQRSRRPFESPKILPSSNLSSVDIFKRTEQAQWLNSETLKDFLGIAEFNLKPVFVDQEGQLTFRVPDTLGDFAPFFKLEPSAGQTAIILKALTLIGFSDLMLEPSYLTVFDYPFEVTSLKNLERLDESKINLQLVSFIGGRLQQLSQDLVKSGTDILQWGRQRLEAKRRYEAAVVWQNFNSAKVLIPRPFEIVQQDLDDCPQVTALNPETPTDLPYGQEIDPRCRLPELIKNGVSSALSAEPNLGLVVFEAAPLVPIKAKSIAATRFRLSATGTQPEWAGKLRSPQISPVASSQLLGCSKWDQVSFEQVTTLDYPSTTPQSVNQPPLPLPLPSFPVQGGRTIVPPLIDIVAWAARPGETTRSLWSLERLTYQEKLHQQAGTHPVSVNLRRPRAVAGSDESVRLNVINFRSLNQQFFYANLQLTQVLGTTPIPESIYGVVVSKRNFYTSKVNLVQASNSPALFYYKENSGTFELESLELIAISHQNFKAKDRNLDGDKKLVTQTALLWSSNSNKPQWNPKETNLENVLVKNLPNPSDKPWEILNKNKLDNHNI